MAQRHPGGGCHVAVEGPGPCLAARRGDRVVRAADKRLHIGRLGRRGQQRRRRQVQRLHHDRQLSNSITLGFIISRDFGWGLVLVNDKWDLHVGSDEPVTLAIDNSREPIPVHRQGGRCPWHPGAARECRPGGERHARWPAARRRHAIRQNQLQARPARATPSPRSPAASSDNLEGEKAGGTDAFAAPRPSHRRER